MNFSMPLEHSYVALDQKLYRPDDIVCECYGLLLVCNLIVPLTVTMTKSTVNSHYVTMINVIIFFPKKSIAVGPY